MVMYLMKIVIYKLINPYVVKYILNAAIVQPQN